MIIGDCSDMTRLYEIGFPVFSLKEAFLTALSITKKQAKPTFTDQSRNKFGVKHEILIY
jgi:hypothetical protein